MLPAPASVRVLEGTGAAFESTNQSVELVTPTGAAILAACARFERPAMSLLSIGYGIGARETPGNALAVWIGGEVESQTGTGPELMTELLSVPDGRILVHSLTEPFAELLRTLNPDDEQIRPRSPERPDR